MKHERKAPEQVQIAPTSRLWDKGARAGEVVARDKRHPHLVLVNLGRRLGRLWVNVDQLLEA